MTKLAASRLTSHSHGPGVVSSKLPAVFAQPAAYGDLLTAFLAVLAYLTLPGGLGIVLTWTFNLVGTADLLNAFYIGIREGLPRDPGLLGATYFIPTFYVPLLLIIHGLVFWLLLRGKPNVE